MLNSEINSSLAKLGHTDQLVIADAGLPISHTTKRIDLALIPGVPSFLETFKVMLEVMQIEKVILADEIQIQNRELNDEISEKNKVEFNKPSVVIEYISHEEFKAKTRLDACKAVIRTGECTPYANIILESGVVF